MDTKGQGDVIVIKLADKSLELLKKCLERHNPSLISGIESSNSDSYTVDFYNELRGIVGDELCVRGLQANYEPNEYGLRLEALIDEIGRLFLYDRDK